MAIDIANGVAYTATSEDQSQPQANDYIWLPGDGKLGQTFRAGLDQEIAAVELCLQKVGSPDGYVWVEIWTTTGTPPDDVPNQPIAGAVSTKIKVSDITSTEPPGEMCRFYLPKGISLTSGTRYAIVLRGDYNSSDTDYVKAWYWNTNTYANGRACGYNSSTSTWYGIGTSPSYDDFAFATRYAADADANAILLDKLWQRSSKAGGDFINGWIQFNGTGTIAIQDSFNVSGITDNGTGNYTVTWDTDFANDDYGVCPMSNASQTVLSAVAAGSMSVLTRTGGGTNADVAIICVIAIGD